MNVRRSPSVRKLTITAAAAAAMCVVAPWAIGLGPVPVSLTTLLICLAAYLLDWRQAAAAVLIYVLAGAAGLPVFSGFAGGLGWLTGPTGGFILGYIPMAAVAAAGVRRAGDSRVGQGCALLGASVLLSLTGTLWYCLQTRVNAAAGAAVCVLPFLPGDSVKLMAALAVGPALRHRLEKAGLT